jgi:transposase-like protein
MKIIKRWGKRYIKKDCFFCRKELTISKNDLKVDYYQGIVAQGRYTCPHCGNENYIHSYDVNEFQK